MAKFCGNCGAQSDDYAAVCGNCGAPFAGGSPAPAKKNPMDALKNNKLVKYIVMGVAALLVVVILFVGIGALIPSPEKTAEKYVKYLINEKFDKIEKLCSEQLIEYIDDQNKQSIRDYARDVKDGFDESVEDSVGRDAKISYKVVDTDIYGKDSAVFEEVLDYFDESESWEDINDAKKIAVVTIEYTAEKGDDYVTWLEDISLVKAKGGWKILRLSDVASSAVNRIYNEKTETTTEEYDEWDN